MYGRVSVEMQDRVETAFRQRCATDGVTQGQGNVIQIFMMNRVEN